jgi:hypothetical protein
MDRRRSALLTRVFAGRTTLYEGQFGLSYRHRRDGTPDHRATWAFKPIAAGGFF